MRKFKILATSLALTATVGTTAVVSSCNKNGTNIDISNVEHGSVTCSELVVGKEFTIKYKPDAGWSLDYAIIQFEGKDPLKPGDDYSIINDVIKVYSYAVTSTKVKITIKATESKFAILYKHLLGVTEQYFRWDYETNPINCKKTDKTVTVKIKKIADYTGKILNPRVTSNSSISVSPASVDLSDMSLNQTKTMTFTWEQVPQDIAFRVDVDTTLIEEFVPTTESKVFKFNDVPEIINATDTKLKIKCQFIKLPTYQNAVIKATFTAPASTPMDPIEKTISTTTLTEQTVEFDWSSAGVIPHKIKFELIPIQ